MSKSSRNTAFRKVDVDQYSEEAYEEDQVADDGVTGPSDAEVQSYLSKYIQMKFTLFYNLRQQWSTVEEWMHLVTIRHFC